MSDFKNKIVVVVNEKLPVGKAMNALSHTMAGFGAYIGKENLIPNKYEDIDGNVHDNISEMPIIVLKAGSNKIRKLRKAAIENLTWERQALKIKEFLQDLVKENLDSIS